MYLLYIVMTEVVDKKVEKNISLEDIVNYINNNPLPKQTNNGVYKGAFFFYPSLKNILNLSVNDLLAGLLENYKNRMIKLLRGKMFEYYIIYYLRSKGFNVLFNYLKDFNLGIDFTVVYEGKQKFFYIGADSKLTKNKLKRLINRWRKEHLFVKIMLYRNEDVEEVNGWIIPKMSFLNKIIEVIKK